MSVRNWIDWNVEGRDRRALDLWMTGESSSKIAAKLTTEWGQMVTKSALIGHLHRINAPARPNPIKVVPRFPPQPRAPRAPKVTLATVTAAPAEFPPALEEEISAPPPAPIERPPMEMQTVDPAPLAPPAVKMQPSGCCWPMWSHNGRASDLAQPFCDGPHELGKPYCDEHRRMSRARG